MALPFCETFKVYFYFLSLVLIERKATLFIVILVIEVSKGICNEDSLAYATAHRIAHELLAIEAHLMNERNNADHFKPSIYAEISVVYQHTSSTIISKAILMSQNSLLSIMTLFVGWKTNRA